MTTDNIIAENVKYIGVDDDTLDLFEGQYEIPNGISYNSYIIADEKVAVLDTVDHRKSDEWMDNLEAALDARKPDYLVISHLEPDHSGTLKRFLDRYPDCVALCSAKARPMMTRFFDENIASRARVVAEGEIISLGKHSLQFFMAPLVHWPEVMVTYDSCAGILFSADAFGKFGSLSVKEPWADEARRYYFNICGKFGTPVQAFLKKTSALSIKMVCPLHGPILVDNLDYYFELYDIWSSYRSENKGIFIAYCSLHGNTAAAAMDLERIILAKSPDTKVVTCDLVRSDMSQALSDAFRYDRIVLAAPTYDGGIMPAMDDFMHHLQSKAYQDRRFAIIENGSWAPVAGKKMIEQMQSLKNMTFVPPMVTVESVVKDSTLEALDTLATNLI